MKPDTFGVPLYNMHWRDFEYFVSELWSRRGWVANTTQETNDKGVDTVAWHPFIGNRLDIQAKQWNCNRSRISYCEVDEYFDRAEDTDIPMVIVATAEFTDDCRREGSKRSDVELVGINRLCNLLKELNLTHLPAVYESGQYEVSTGTDVLLRISQTDIPGLDSFDFGTEIIDRIATSKHSWKLLDSLERYYMRALKNTRTQAFDSVQSFQQRIESGYYDIPPRELNTQTRADNVPAVLDQNPAAE